MTAPIVDAKATNAEVGGQTPKIYTWERQINGKTYRLTTDKSLLDLSLFNKAFASGEVYWTDPMPEDAIKLMVENSCVLSLYYLHPLQLEANHNIKSMSSPHVNPQQIGFGRIITDYTTVAYITDVWIEPEYQGLGLGKWMVQGMKEIIDSFPSLRRAVLLTKIGGKGVGFYERELGMRVADSGRDAYGFMQFVPE